MCLNLWMVKSIKLNFQNFFPEFFWFFYRIAFDFVYNLSSFLVCPFFNWIYFKSFLLTMLILGDF